MPKGFDVDEHGYPKEIGADGYGKTFSLYVADQYSRNKMKYHAKRGCSKAYDVINCYDLYKIKATTDISDCFCKRCAKDYEFPDLSWVLEYEDFLVAESTYKNLQSEFKTLIEKLHRQYEKGNALILFRRKKLELLRSLNKRAEIYINKS